MAMNDVSIRNALIVILICQVATVLFGYKMQKTTLSISYLNAISVLGIFVFWVIKNLHTKQPNLEIREIVVVGLEVCVLLFALYSIIGFYNKAYVKVINYIGFGIHVLATIGMLFFITTFKLNRLF